MPAHRKSPERRQRTNTPDLAVVRTDAAPTVLGPSPALALTAPLKSTRDRWEDFWSSPLAAYVSPSDYGALQRLFLLYDEHERAMREYRKERVTEGSRDQLVVHPLAKQADSFATQITQLEDRFGLTPSSRLKLGIVLGAAARSLDDVNRGLASDDDDDEDETDDVDPRLAAIEARVIDR